MECFSALTYCSFAVRSKFTRVRVDLINYQALSAYVDVKSFFDDADRNYGAPFKK